MQIPDSDYVYYAVVAKSGADAYEMMGGLLIQCEVHGERQGQRQIVYTLNYRTGQWEGSEEPERRRVQDCHPVQQMQAGGPGLGGIVAGELGELALATTFPIGMSLIRPDTTQIEQHGGGASAEATGGSSTAVSGSTSQSTSRSTSDSTSTSTARNTNTNTNTNTNRTRVKNRLNSPGHDVSRTVNINNWMDGVGR
jgi:hypothetical protein